MIYVWINVPNNYIIEHGDKYAIKSQNITSSYCIDVL